MATLNWAIDWNVAKRSPRLDEAFGRERVMLPRKKLDISYSDLLAAGVRVCWSGSAKLEQQRLEASWASEREGDAVACLSVRTGFDLVLSALALPRGSEIILSAINIRDMVRIIHEHGLVPVPADMDMQTLAVDAADVERLITPHTRLIVIAHLFGSRMPLDSIAEASKRRGLLLVEDCAQAYLGNGFRGHPEADVSMFSFGPIKTNTALGGALLSFRDRSFASAVRALEAELPRQAPSAFFGRVTKYMLLKTLLFRPAFTLFVAACGICGRSHDEVISGLVRGFGGQDFFARIRRRPCYALLALLRRRLGGFDRGTIAARIGNAEAAIKLLPGVPRPGCRAAVHSHWVFPIRVRKPEILMHRLWGAGLDATRGASSLHVVEPPPDRSELAPQKAAKAMSEILYLPVYPGVSEHCLNKLGRETVAFLERH